MLSPPTPPGMRVRTGRFEKLRFTPCCLCEGAGVGLLHCPERTRLSTRPSGPFRQCGHLMPFPTHRLQESLLLVRPFSRRSDLMRPLLTSRSRLNPVTLSGENEISPGKNALLHCTTAGFTPPPFGHESFAVTCLLALAGAAFYPTFVHRPAVSIHASSPHSGALMQLRFTSLVVTNSRRGLTPLRVRPCWAHKQNGLRQGGGRF